VTYLLDVNVLVALLDQDHIYHDAAHSWFRESGSASWATCPVTEIGLIRVLGHSRYPKGPGTPAAAAELLSGIRALAGHIFWTDETSLFDAPHVRLERIGTSAQVTDTYLLALAVAKSGRLATFDRRLSAAAVEGGAAALQVVG
jgi:toxin-antitoxin system PIN domain toxin